MRKAEFKFYRDLGIKGGLGLCPQRALERLPAQLRSLRFLQLVPRAGARSADQKGRPVA